jgi:tight adherence protein B
MLAPVLLGLLCLLMLLGSLRLFYVGSRKAGAARVAERLNSGQPQRVADKPLSTWLGRTLLLAGLGQADRHLPLWLCLWALGMLLGWVLASAAGFAVMFGVPPLLLRAYVALRYRRRMRRMLEQLPNLLDHTVRSLKSGRTLTDAVLGAVQASNDPLREAMGRVERNVQLGVSLPEAVSDMAEFYDQDEMRLFALGLGINHRYGGNASELLESLIKMIREREQGARQLRAMTGETRTTAIVLAVLPLGLVGYFLLTNPGYLMHMWNDSNGQLMLLAAFALQTLGCLALWRMLRSL